MLEGTSSLSLLISQWSCRCYSPGSQPPSLFPSSSGRARYARDIAFHFLSHSLACSFLPDISLGADLLGLDFTGAPSVSPDLTHNHAPSSYAVDQSTTTWVDSQLLELGVERAEPLQTPSSVLQRQVTPVSDVEEQLLQLGLDASKTTWRKSTPEAPSSQQKLSEEARTLLETLPDLSFMLSELVATQ